MLRDPLLQRRYERYLERAIALARSEVDRTQGSGELNEIARFYLQRFEQCRSSYIHRWKRDLVAAFAELQERGLIEIITCAATHGFLPLMENFPESVRAQILDCAGRLS
jgi:1,4-alpha-glucan branching enzyme